MNITLFHRTALKLTVVIAATIAAFFVLTSNVYAETAAEGDQTNASRTSLLLEGGYPETVVVGSSAVAETNDMLYAGLNAPNGMFWSDDFGEIWHGMTGDADTGSVIDVDVSDTPGTAFMIGGISLYRTQDNGVTWTQLEDVQNVSQYFAAGPDGMLAVPTRNGEIAVSTDDGDTFTTYTFAGGVMEVAVTADNTVLALAGEGDTVSLYTLDSGASAFVDTGVSCECRVVIAHPTDPNYWVIAGSTEVKYTADGGVTAFESMTVPEGVSTGASVIRANGDVYLGNQYSSDNGATWNGAGGWNWITFDDVNGYVYSASTRGVGRATSADGPFIDKVTGMTGVTISDIAQDSTKEVVWLAVQGGFAKSINYLTATNAGIDPTWEYPITTGGPDGSGVAVWVDQTDAYHVVVSGGGISYSTDGGDTFTEAITDVSGQISVTEIDDWDGTLYAAYSSDSGGGVMVSTDAGIHWTDLAMPSAAVQSIIPTGDGVIAGLGSEQDSTASKRGIYMYEDGTWTHMTSDPDHILYGAIVNDLLVTPTNSALVAVTSGEGMEGIIAVSNDYGATWTKVGGDDIPNDFWGQGLALSTVDDDQIFASTARPAGTGYIYTCSLSKDTCDIYYTGLVDETFNAMLFDGLISGSNVGLFTYQGKAALAIKKLKNKKHKQRLRVVLSDKATTKVLNDRRVKLYRKKLGKKKFSFFKKGKMKNGKVVFKFKKKVKGTFQARWAAGGSDSGIYASATSSNLSIKK